MTTKETNEAYLGDGLYASFDGWHIWLRTNEGNEVALEPKVYRNLVDYHAKLSTRKDNPQQQGAVKANDPY